MNAQHSALNHCDVVSNCNLCFNNIVDSRGLILMLIPKVATQSIVKAYQASGVKGAPVFRSKDYVEDRMPNDELVVGFIRNPFDRLVSCWKDRCVDQLHRTYSLYGIRQDIEFAELVDVIVNIPHDKADKHWRPVSCDLISSDGVLMPHYVVRYENLEEEFKQVSDLVYADTGIKLGDLPHINDSDKGNYREYYTQELIDKVAAYYRDDLENFDYGI